MSLVEVIKQICAETVKANKPLEMVSGSVLSINPFKIKIDQRLILTEAQLTTGSYNVSNFNVGDNVDMLRVQGGKKYYILPVVSTTSSVQIDYDSENENLIVGG